MNLNEYCNRLTNSIFQPVNKNKKHFYIMGSDEFLANVVCGRGLDYDNFPFIIPNIDKEKLLRIDRKTKNDIEDNFGIYSELDWQCNTIANVFLEKLLQKLSDVMYFNKCQKFSLDFYDLIEITLSNKSNASNEKEGNINVSFRFNHSKRICYNNLFDLIGYNNISISSFYTQIDSEVQVELINKYGIIISDTGVSTAVTYSLIKNIPELLINNLDNPIHSINFNDILEFHATNINGNRVCHIRPGMNSKLIVKSDEITESDYYDD